MVYYYICAVFTLISAAVSFGFSIDAYLKSKPQQDIAFANAKYAVSRSFSVFFVVVGCLIFISKTYLIALSIVMIGIQLFDGIIGTKISRFKTIGPMFTAIGNIVVLILFLMNWK